MSDEKRTPAEHGLRDTLPNAADGAPIDPGLGSPAPDAVVLESMGAESAGDAGSDASPRSNPANTTLGEAMNSGPAGHGLVGTEEYAARGQASQEPGRDAESGVPAHEAEKTAPGDNLR